MAEACLGCERIEAAPANLCDGTTVCNFCPAWKAECLTRHKHVQAMRNLGIEGRRAYLWRVQASEGEESHARLKVAFLQDWEARRDSNGAA